MGQIDTYRDLIVWQKAMDLVTECYRLTRSFPTNEQFCLTNQIRRAAISIPSNIAEGSGRGATAANVNHLSIANGSLQELETQLLIAQRLGYVDSKEIDASINLCREVGRLLVGLRRSLKRITEEPH